MMTTLITGATGLNNNLYNLYVQDIISLASTIVLKLDQIGQAMNYLVMQKAGTALLDPDDRTTWKYYQNISGAYNFTDTPMFVESLDGNGQISFDKTTLAANPITQNFPSSGQSPRGSRQDCSSRPGPPSPADASRYGAQHAGSQRRIPKGEPAHKARPGPQICHSATPFAANVERLDVRTCGMSEWFIEGSRPRLLM